MTDIGAMLRREIPPEDLARHARELAGLVSELWIVEDVPYAGGISQMVEVLAATDAEHPELRVGHGVAPAPFRNPMALAMEWATLDRMYPGRVALGLGHGVQDWMRSIGERVSSPLTLIQETHDSIAALLRGEDPEIAGTYRQIAGYELAFPPQSELPISLGVMGPKSLQLSGRIAGGTVVGEGLSPDEIRAARAEIDNGRAVAERVDDHRLTAFVAFFSGQPDQVPPTPVGAIDGWRALSPDPVAVAAQLHEVGEAGADAVIAVPLISPGPSAALDALAQLHLVLPHV